MADSVLYVVKGGHADGLAPPSCHAISCLVKAVDFRVLWAASTSFIHCFVAGAKM
jgi:hypothetical protein